MSLDKNNSILMICILVSGLFLSYIYAPAVGLFEPDSSHYLSSALAIFGLQISDTSVQLSQDGLAVRPFGYPFLLGSALIVTGGKVGEAVVVLHTALWFLSIWWGLCLYSKKREKICYLSIHIAVALLCLPTWEQLMTEWTVFVFLNMLATAIVRYQRNHSYVNLSILSLLIGILSLVRLEFAMFSLLPFLLIKQRGIKSYLTATIGPILIGLALLSNYLQQGYLSWKDLPSVGVFCLVSGLGLPEESSQPLINEIALDLKKEGRFLDFSSMLSLATLDPKELFEIMGLHHRVIIDKQNSWSLDWATTSRTQNEYAKAVIRNNIPAYIMLVVCGLIPFFFSLPLVAALLIRKTPPTLKPEWVAAISLSAIHLIRAVLVAFINVQHLRYFLPTFASALAAILVFYILQVQSNPQKSAKNN